MRKGSLTTMRSAWLGLTATVLLAPGCSSHVTGSQIQTKDTGGLLMKVSARPGLPQNIGSADDDASAQVGDNTLIVELADDKTNAPIPDANVSAAPSTTLVSEQRVESGRAEGNGVYYVPIRFGVPDTYTITVTVDRPGHPETSAQFKIAAE